MKIPKTLKLETILNRAGSDTPPNTQFAHFDGERLAVSNGFAAIVIVPRDATSDCSGSIPREAIADARAALPKDCTSYEIELAANAYQYEGAGGRVSGRADEHAEINPFATAAYAIAAKPARFSAQFSAVALSKVAKALNTDGVEVSFVERGEAFDLVVTPLRSDDARNEVLPVAILCGIRPAKKSDVVGADQGSEPA